MSILLNTNNTQKITKRDFLKTLTLSAFGLAFLQATGLFNIFSATKVNTTKKPQGYSTGGYGV